jgi:phosphotransferase system HPr (HPr) family protein
MQTQVLRVLHGAGLHARPAADFVKQANRFQSTLRVRNLTRETAWVDCKSILSVLTLGVEQGHQIEITAEGPDEEDAIQALADVAGSE